MNTTTDSNTLNVGCNTIQTLQMKNFGWILFIISTFLCYCQDKSKNNALATNNGNANQRTDSLINALHHTIDYLSDSLIKDKSGILKNYLDNYQSDTCGTITYSNKELKENFEGISTIQSIKNQIKMDTVFVLPPFNYCDEGESYCFFDESLPRLLTDSYCCQPENLFVLEDIDEDGLREIGIYYSSCASRYKSLQIYTLKANSWRKIGTSTFDVLTQDPTKVTFSTLVKKQGRGKFRICNFEDGQIKWKTIAMK
jgi:hypothetical protein